MMSGKSNLQHNDRTGRPNKMSKYSAEILETLAFDVIEALKDHYDELTVRIKNEEGNIKPRKGYLLTLAQEQSATMKALLPYANVKPTSEAIRDESSSKPVAVSLTVQEEPE